MKSTSFRRMDPQSLAVTRTSLHCLTTVLSFVPGRLRRSSLPFSWGWFCSLWLCVLSACRLPSSDQKPKSEHSLPPVPIESHSLHNLYKLTPKLFSGSAPETDASFEELSRLGIRTIVSVDGTKPNVAAARQHGIRYVHLPIGYDGVPTNRIVELIQAFQESHGPVFVHCHHGKHRGPAAAAVLCEATAGWSTNRAVEWLHMAGTSSEYPGLYRSVTEFQTPVRSTLRPHRLLPEIATTPPMVDIMVAIDGTFDHLRAAPKNGWSPPTSSDFRNSQELATVFWEQWKELRRIPSVQIRDEEFQNQLQAMEMEANTLRIRLSEAPCNSENIREILQSIGQLCTQCHRRYRN